MTRRDLRNIPAKENNCRGALPSVKMATNLLQYFYLLMEKPLGRYFQVGLLTIRWHSATRKHPFLYLQGDRSGLRMLKKG